MCTPPAEDCYLIGRQDYLNDDWVHAREWMLEALNKFDQGQSTLGWLEM